MADVVYVLTHGKFVVGASADKEEMVAEGLRVLRHTDSMEDVWEIDPYMRYRETLRYRPARSGRWNTSDVSITRMVVGEVGH